MFCILQFAILTKRYYIRLFQLGNACMIRILFITFLLIFICNKNSLAQIKIENLTKDSIVTFQAGDYEAGKIKRFFLGSNYRDVWTAPVSAPVFDLNKSGLKVTKQGGSRQTINLRLEDKNGNEYVLRSIDKRLYQALGEKLRETFVADLVEDQTSTGHPYGALTIPPMASAIAVYHTNPILVYIPYDTAFKEFADVLANEPALFERRPDEDQSHVESFGNPPHVVGTEKMKEHLRKDHNNIVDEVLYARSRLFDMLINDWGRHEDQWRWGIFKTDSGKVFQPIPRDRDHAYFKINGLLPTIVSQPWAKRNLVSFDYCFTDIKGLNKSAYNIDNRILTSLSRKKWIEQAEYIKANLTNEIIEKAIQELPNAAYKLTGEEIIAKLKARREQLSEVAGIYYEILAKEVTITGSYKREFFNVRRVNDDSTVVEVQKVNNDGSIGPVYYRRAFYTKETKHICLMGSDGDDVFAISGDVKKGIYISIKAGEGNDSITDNSEVKRGRKKTIICDKFNFSQISTGPEAKVFCK